MWPSEVIRPVGSWWQVAFVFVVVVVFLSQLRPEKGAVSFSQGLAAPLTIPSLFKSWSTAPWESWERWPPRYDRQVPLLFWQSQSGSGRVLEEDTQALIPSCFLLPSPPVQKVPSACLGWLSWHKELH